MTADGLSLAYGCYSTGPLDALNKSLVRLTKSSGLEVFYYTGCTDGTNFGRFFTFGNGEVNARHQFSADIGLRASMALVVLLQGKDEDAFAALIEIYSEWNDGGAVHSHAEEALANEDFDDDEYEFEKDCVIAGLIGATLRTYPELLVPVATQKALLKLLRSFVHTKGWMTKFGNFDLNTNQCVDELIARLESLEIDHAIKARTRKSGRAAAARETVRL